MSIKQIFNKFLFLFCDNLKYLFILLGDAIFLIIYCNLFITSWISFGSFGIAMPELSKAIEALLIMLPYVVTHIYLSNYVLKKSKFLKTLIYPSVILISYITIYLLVILYEFGWFCAALSLTLNFLFIVLFIFMIVGLKSDIKVFQNTDIK